ncbi:MAG: EAL domain-containing protein [Cyanobacteriota bacterium]|nr:EAL domain-containing protein [Cyanobacteriota bacterium]
MVLEILTLTVRQGSVEIALLLGEGALKAPMPTGGLWLAGGLCCLVGIWLNIGSLRQGDGSAQPNSARKLLGQKYSRWRKRFQKAIARRLLGLSSPLVKLKIAENRIFKAISPCLTPFLNREMRFAMTHNSLAAIAIVNGRGQIINASDRAETLLGLKKSQIQQRTYNAPEWNITDFQGNPLPEEQLPFQRVLTTGKTIFNARHAIEWPDGTKKYLSIDGSPLKNKFGQIVAVAFALSDISETHNMDEALRESEARLSAIVEATSDAIVIIDREGCIRFANPAAAQLFNRPLTTLMGYYLGWPSVNHEITEIEILQPTGKLIIAEMRVTATTWDKQEAYLASLRDITERKYAEEKLRESEEKYRQIVEMAAEGIWMLDRSHKTTFVNQQMAEMLGYEVDEMMGKSLFDFVHDTERRNAQTHIIRRQQGIEEKYDFKFRCKDKSPLWTTVAARPLFNSEGRYSGALKMVADITDRKLAEAQLEHNAFYDSLTDLPNRTLFMERLARALYYARRNSGYPFAVLFLDIDNFKTINDSLGHVVGDRLLVEIARRLETCLRENDTLARLGGDEFTILLEETESLTAAIPIAQKIHDILKCPFKLEGRDVFTNASIGIAIGSKEYDTPEELLRDADAAMYQAKDSGKGHYALFDRAMHRSVLARLQLETDLRLALEREEFLLYYQPIINLQSGLPTGFEALVRWQHPRRGLVPPDEFIPVAEEMGLIVPLGWWVLRKACLQLSRWQRMFPDDSPLSMGVNLSGKQLKEPDVVEQIRDILAETGIKGSCLKLELVESLLMEDTEEMLDTLAQLRAMKIQLAIDDFGTGYSSLSYLHRFPVTTLKIDRSFVMGLKSDLSNGEIVKAVVSLAQALKMNAIAEGIETAEQFRYLRELGCEFGQGYFIEKPLALQGATLFLARRIQSQAVGIHNE